MPMPIVRIVCLLAPLAALSLYSLAVANAQGSPDAREACTPDAMRLCSEFIPDVAKITACMKAKHSLLSVSCRTAMAGGHEGKREVRHESRHEVRHETHYRRVRAEHCDKFTHLCS
jgi:hypothetical protein